MRILRQLAAEQVRQVCVVPVAFVSDHVETLGEIDHEAREEALGLGLRPPSFAHAFNEMEGERCSEELLVAARPFTAVVCANDRLAVGAMTAFRRHGVESIARRLASGHGPVALTGAMRELTDAIARTERALAA